MTYVDHLRQSAKESGSIACLGLDIVPEQVPHHNEVGGFGIRESFDYIQKLIGYMKEQGVLPGAIKPNEGFYAMFDSPTQASFAGSITLGQVIEHIHQELPTTPIILDAKRGDIARSSQNYADEAFNGWRADCVTVSPYMGTDSVMPFIDTALEYDGGVYILNRTSNKGAEDFQDLDVFEDIKGLANYLVGEIVECPELFTESLGRVKLDKLQDFLEEKLEGMSSKLYEAVAHKIVEWGQGKPGVGAVVDATKLDELERIMRIYQDTEIAVLTPGAGTQGGSAADVMERVRNTDYDEALLRINSSSGITHKWAKDEGLRAKLKGKAQIEYIKVATDRFDALNEEIGFRG